MELMTQQSPNPVNLIGKDGVLYHSTFLNNTMTWEREASAKLQPTIRTFMDLQERLVTLVKSLTSGTSWESKVKELLLSIQDRHGPMLQDQWDISMTFVPNVASYSNLRQELDPRGRAALNTSEEYTYLTLLFCVAFIALSKVANSYAHQLAGVISDLRKLLQQKGLSQGLMASNVTKLETTQKHLFRSWNTGKMFDLMDDFHQKPFGKNQHCCDACDFFMQLYRRADLITPVITVLPLPGEAVTHSSVSEGNLTQKEEEVNVATLEIANTVLELQQLSSSDFQTTEFDEVSLALDLARTPKFEFSENGRFRDITMAPCVLNASAKPFVPRSMEPEVSVPEKQQQKPPRRRGGNKRL